MKIPFANAMIAIALAVAGLAAGGWHSPAGAQDASATQSNAAGGVTVKVTPRKVAGGGWEFQVVFDTHSQELRDEVERSAVLVIDGREYQPTQWQGAAAGGHHREGVLRFAGVAEAAGAIELRLARPGEASPRVFRWDATSLR